MKFGNTIQISPSVHWCFTFNNPTLDDKTDLLKWCADSAVKTYVFQLEKGTNGTLHYQGYIAFDKKRRPKSIFTTDKIHWEKCRNVKASIAYCQKEETAEGEIYSNIKSPPKIIVLNDSQLYDWQIDIVNIVETQPDDRSIYWYWEPVGNVGKSIFCKYLCIKYGALLISGKSSDIKYAISEYTKSNKEYPRIILLDVPRTSADYVSYEALESIKNGCFFSGKYEGGMCIGNPPHLIIFANSEPIFENMSADRWRCNRIPGVPVHSTEPPSIARNAHDSEAIYNANALLREAQDSIGMSWLDKL